MSDYETEEQKLKDLRCDTCGGSGRCDDADFGDISCNTWECPKCKGNGFKAGAQHRLIYFSNVLDGGSYSD